MARGESGRIVLEIDPTHKDDLYTALTKDGLTLKDWFLRQAGDYLRNRNQMSLFGGAAVAEDQAPYLVNSGKPAGRSAKAKKRRTKAK